MFASVSTSADKFISVVQCRHVRSIDNEEFLGEAEIAFLAGWCVGLASCYYFPFDGVRDGGVLELPDILAQCCSVSVLLVPEAAYMAVVASFEGVFGEPDIRFFFVVVLSCYCGLIDDTGCKAVSFEGT